MTSPQGLSTLRERPLRAIVIGGSAGGIEAATVLLSALPRPLLVPVLLVLHIAAGSRAQWPLVFRNSTAPVHEAEDKDVAEPGNVYVAPPDYHLLVDEGARLSLAADERVNLARPAIDVLFESAAWSFGAAVLGVVLSGANADGAAGLAAIRERGGKCWVQAPETAAAVAMPRAAIEAVPDALVLSLREMADALGAWVA
ncbi:MAG TPA: chemotaxis protein CheB [Polyangiaceae bacterium]|nr:chemotaxis protein CheB [Polyangiaceae bacterium]